MKALVLCGGKPQIALIHELKRRNITAILADANDKATAVQYADVFYKVSTLDVVGIEKIALAEKVDFILSVCADQMLLVAAQLSEKLNLPCYIDYETAKNVSSKEYMKRIFVENNIPTAKYIVGSSISLSVIEGLNFPLIVKPVDCYSSRGVKKVLNYDELLSAFENAKNLSRTGTVIVEEFVEGLELSVDIYVENGKVNIGAMICYDREFPESARILMLKGAEIILVPNACDMNPLRINQLNTRAFENMVGVAMANYPGEGWGGSCAFSPVVFDENGNCLDNAIVKANDILEDILIAEFDMDRIRAYREQETWGNAYRKPAAYTDLVSFEVKEPFIRNN